MNRDDYYHQVVRLWTTSKEPKTPRVDFYRSVATKWTSASVALERDNDVALALFRRLVMANPDALRHRLLGFNAARRRRLTRRSRLAIDSLSVEPDLLGPINELRYEPAHTQILAHLMDPHRSPALAGSLLAAFLSLAGVPPESQPEASSDVQVSAECWLPGAGRVDLRIEVPRALLFVEIKVDAEEGLDQLKRYYSALEATRGIRSGHLVFLTLPDGEPAKSTVPHEHVDFLTLLRVWLPHAAPTGQEAGYLARYLKSVAVVCGICGQGQFEDWGFSRQNQALSVVEGMGVEV